MDLKILETPEFKIARSDDYNFNFFKENGYFERWGKTKEDDPEVAPSPEILDIEVTTICKGPGGKLCNFCYKKNSPKGENMSFENFKKIIDKMTKATVAITDENGVTTFCKPETEFTLASGETVTAENLEENSQLMTFKAMKIAKYAKNRSLMQAALGLDASCTSNPDVWKMMDYCRNNPYTAVIPNVTVADIDDATADNLVNVCGAVAVSRYEDKNYCYDSVKKLTDRGLKQTNIHIMISKETMDQAIETIKDYKNEERLAELNAIVFLSLKRKGRGINHTPLTSDEFKQLVDLAFDLEVPIGFDSCSAHKFLKSIEDLEEDRRKALVECVEPCESTCQSQFCSVSGYFFPCSFVDGEGEWKEGLSVLNCDDFLKDVWHHPKTEKFRSELLANKRNCFYFEV